MTDQTLLRDDAGSEEPTPSGEPALDVEVIVDAESALAYRPYLDGLRSVAVYLVVLFHAGSDHFEGGYVGVDVFFVLSGFLVTQLLLRDLNWRGSIRFGRFYSRRFRRLLPAAFVTLVLTAVVFTAIASPVEVLDAVGGFKAAFLYGTNWFFIHDAAGYFGANIDANPVLHFWSLAVEEQFYLLWPLMLGGLFLLSKRFGARQQQLLRLTVAAGALLSLGWAWTLRTSDPNHAYYGTDTRAYQLLAGALVALTPALIVRLRRREGVARGTAIVGVLALLAIATTWRSLDAIQRGTLVTVITVAIIVALEAARGGIAHRILSIEPLVYLGKISYGTYLWHWPVIIVITHSFDVATSTTVAMTVLIATALASLSYQVLEHPIRVSGLLDRHRRIVIATGLATSVIAAFLIIPAVTDRAHATSSAAAAQLATAGFTPVPQLDWRAVKNDFPDLHNCFEQPVTTCTVVHGSGPHILLIGDSHAGMLIPTITAIAEEHHFTLSVSVHGGCPWQRNLYVVPIDILGETDRLGGCERFKEDMYTRVIPDLDPDVIITMNEGHEDPTVPSQYLGPEGKVVKSDSPEFASWIKQTTSTSLADVRKDGRKFVLVEPIPRAPEDELACLSSASVTEQCRYAVSSQPSAVERTYRAIDQADPDVWSLDMDQLVCPYLPICDPIVNDQVVKIDRHHLTRSFATTLAPAVDTYLRENGIIPG